MDGLKRLWAWLAAGGRWLWGVLGLAIVAAVFFFDSRRSKSEREAYQNRVADDRLLYDSQEDVRAHVTVAEEHHAVVETTVREMGDIRLVAETQIKAIEDRKDDTAKSLSDSINSL